MPDLDLREPGCSPQRPVQLLDYEWETVDYVLNLAQAFLLTGKNPALSGRVADIQQSLRDQGALR